MQGGLGNIHSIAEAGAARFASPDRTALQRNHSAHDMIGALARSWLEHADCARLMLSDDLNILWANATALSALAEGRDIEDRLGILSTINASLQPLLHHFVVNSDVGITSWSMPRADGDGRLIFRSCRIAEGRDGVYGVTFFGSGVEFQTHFLELEEVFHLTRSEHRVLLELVNGHETEVIARMLNVSIETIRSHIRSLYRKLNVRSREALFHKVQPYRL
ncbi:helix-turn-helix transcriptional regulator [Allosphingosinicella humi]